MSDVEPRNNLSWRVTVLEREVERLKEGRPDVIAERVSTLSARMIEYRQEVNEDIADLRADVKGVRRILLGFLTGVTFVVLGAVVAVILGS